MNDLHGGNERTERPGPGPTDASATDEEELHGYRRNAYLVVLPLIFGALVLAWIFIRSLDSFQRLVLPLLGLWIVVAWLAILVWNEGRILRLLERLTYTIGGAVYLGRFVYTLFFVPPSEHFAADLGIFLAWTLVFYVLTFFIFDTMPGLLWSVLYYAAFVVLGLVYLVPRFVAGDIVVIETHILFQYYLASAAFMTLLFAFGHFKAEYMRARIRANTLREIANTDFLTGLPNRRRLYSLLNQELKRSERYEYSFSVVLFDLDEFKEINDGYGHDVGDRILQELADLVRRNVREVDSVGRWGGEEFLLLAPGVGLDETQHLAERLQRILADYEFEDVKTVTASFGVATYQPGDTMSTMLERVDEALYRAKERGRNRVEVAA